MIDRPLYQRLMVLGTIAIVTGFFIAGGMHEDHPGLFGSFVLLFGLFALGAGLIGMLILGLNTIGKSIARAMEGLKKL